MSDVQVFYDMPEAEYHATDALNKSGMDSLAKSPMHYQHYLASGKEDTDAMRLGRAVHKALLEPEEFHRTWVVAPEVNLSTKSGCNEYVSWLAQVQEITCVAVDVDSIKDLRRAIDDLNTTMTATIVPYTDMQSILGMAEAIRKRKVENHLLTSPGKSEVSVFWTDDETGVKCRCRFDRVTDSGIIIDLKSTRNASPGIFERDAFNRGYQIQDAFYCEGYRQWMGVNPERLAFVAIEGNAPHGISTRYTDGTMFSIGEAQCRKLLRVYADCKKSGNWHGYPEEPLPMSAPSWAVYKFEQTGEV